MVTLFASNGCPYAQRTRALLLHLALPHEVREIDLQNKPADFLALSPTGRVPMLVDGQHLLYESAVINEYLRERAGWAEGFSNDTYQRARERLAMVQFDSVLVGAFFGALKAGGVLDETRRVHVERELDELAKTVAGADAAVNLLAFHVAPHVVRWQWLGDSTPLPAMVAARPALSAWVESITALPVVRDTLPDREENVLRIRELAARR